MNNKHTEKKAPTPKQVSNPASTGNSGPSFETRVQTSRLLAMCMGHPASGQTEGHIVELRFQARVHGHHTDDLVCTVEDKAGARSRGLLQMKRTVAPREKDKAFADSIGAAWTDFSNPQHFTRSTDSFYIVYDNGCAAAMRAAATVAEWARRSASAEEFLHKVAAEQFSNQANRSALAAIRKVASNYARSDITDSEAFEFIKHLNFISHDLDRDGTAEHTSYLRDIVNAGSIARQAVEPKEVWGALAAICVGLNSDAGTVTFENLGAIIGSRLALLFGAVRNTTVSPFDGAPALASIGTSNRSGTASDPIASELARLSSLVESLHRASAPPTADDQAPAARESSVNKFISRQLDTINERLKSLRYRDAFDDLARIGEDRGEFDSHQEARWYLMRAACRWHLEGAECAADDFLQAAALCDDEDKLAAARVRGLLLKHQIPAAIRAGEEALGRFPDSLPVWQVTANARMMRGDAIEVEDIPPAYSDHAEALQMVAWSRHRRGDLAGAAALALSTLDKPSATFFIRDSALSLSLDRAAGATVLTSLRLSDEDKAGLERAVQAFEPRETRLWPVQSPGAMVAATTNLAASFLLLGRPADSLLVLNEARSHGHDSPAFLRVEFEALNRTNRREQALARGKTLINKLSKEALATFGQYAAEAGDLPGVQAAIDAARRLAEEELTLVQMLSGLRWEALYRKDKTAALAEIRGADLLDSDAVPLVAIAGRILNVEGAETEVAALVRRATELLPNAQDPLERSLVAQLFFYTGHYAKAIEVYEALLPHGQHSVLHNDLLFCYMRTGHRVKAKQLINSFPPGWEVEDDTRNLAIELGQLAGDWQLLARLVEPQLSRTPRAASSWLFKVMVAARATPKAVGEAVAAIPEEIEGKVQEVTQIATLELQHGHKERALRRLYVMRRRRMDSAEAAMAHLIAHVAVTEDLPHMEDSLEEAGPGTSVRLITDEGVETVFTVEPLGLPDLPPAQGFISPTSEEARLLQGVRVGSELQIPNNFGGSRTYIVQHISSAYRYLLTLAQQAFDTALVPSKYGTSISVAQSEDGEADFSGLKKQLNHLSKHATSVLDLYAASPITLGGVAKLLGRNILDIVRGWLPDGPALQAGGGNRAEWAKAIERLSVQDAVFVVDAATLAELAFIDELHLLGALPKVFVTSHTRDMVEGKLAEAKTDRSVGTAFERNGQLGYAEITEEQRQREVAMLQTMADAIRLHCEVLPAYGAERIAQLANELSRAVSAEELAVLLLAAEKDATLLAVDARLRSLAGMLEVPGVWPQALLMAARNNGALAPQRYSLAVIKLFLANRTFISVGSDDLTMMTYQGTSWLRHGLKVFKSHISSADTDFGSASNVALEFVKRLTTQGHCHFGPVFALVAHISEALLRHKNCPLNYEAILIERVLESFPSDDSERHVPSLLKQAVMKGSAASRRKAEDELLEDVEVLMCSSPPFIAHVTRMPASAGEASESAPATLTPGSTGKDSAPEAATEGSKEAHDKAF